MHPQFAEANAPDQVRLLLQTTGKGFGKIRNIPDSQVVSDDIEAGFGNEMPLWLFGFLY
ncbi:MAG: hypothetical protein IJ783_00450 [Kiritimatiellae bacterium]|nr:hypothetical protein [Kiritimatiellia bacterium]